MDESEIPGMFSVLEYAHHLPAMPGADVERAGETYVAKFSSRFFKVKYLDAKKTILSKHNSANGTKVTSAQDYTFLNRQVMKLLHKTDDVKKVSVRGERILYKTDVSEKWKEVINPWGVTLAELAAPVFIKPTASD